MPGTIVSPQMVGGAGMRYGLLMYSPEPVDLAMSIASASVSLSATNLGMPPTVRTAVLAERIASSSLASVVGIDATPVVFSSPTIPCLPGQLETVPSPLRISDSSLSRRSSVRSIWICGSSPSTSADSCLLTFV